MYKDDILLTILTWIIVLGFVFVCMRAIMTGIADASEPLPEKSCKEMIADHQRYLPEKCFYELKGDL